MNRNVTHKQQSYIRSQFRNAGNHLNQNSHQSISRRLLTLDPTSIISAAGVEKPTHLLSESSHFSEPTTKQQRLWRWERVHILSYQSSEERKKQKSPSHWPTSGGCMHSKWLTRGPVAVLWTWAGQWQQQQRGAFTPTESKLPRDRSQSKRPSVGWLVGRACEVKGTEPDSTTPQKHPGHVASDPPISNPFPAVPKWSKWRSGIVAGSYQNLFQGVWGTWRKEHQSRRNSISGGQQAVVGRWLTLTNGESRNQNIFSKKKNQQQVKPNGTSPEQSVDFRAIVSIPVLGLGSTTEWRGTYFNTNYGLHSFYFGSSVSSHWDVYNIQSLSPPSSQFS